MKKTINVAIGGCSFTIDEDAYNTLNEYLDRVKAAIWAKGGNMNALDELEVRIADLLKIKLGGRQVVDLNMTKEIIDQLGYPDGYGSSSYNSGNPGGGPAVKKLFRDPDGKKLAGVCSGLSIFLGIDVVLLRVIFLVAFLCGSAGFWIYAVIWIAAPEARTAAEKCELRGIPANAENIRKFTDTK